MFTGLSAFPITPMNEHSVDESAYARLIGQLVDAKVDSIGVLGSTGSYAYLTVEERAHLIQLAVQSADGIPVLTSIGALRTKDILTLADKAQKVGASGLLLAPMSYQQLTEDEVFSLYKMVTESLSVPLCVYDNPLTTHFHFSDELHGRIAELNNIASIKIPGVPVEAEAAKERIDSLRAVIPANVTIGVSGDVFAAAGLNAGCDAWYSVIGGLFPRTAKAIVDASRRGDQEEVMRLSDQLTPIWQLFSQYRDSLRVVATAAELLGWANAPSLPLPLKSLEANAREEVSAVLHTLRLR